MAKLGIISDTHNNLDLMARAVKLFASEGVCKIFHAGDWTATSAVLYFDQLVSNADIPVISVFGNNDDSIRCEILNNNLVLVMISFANTDIFSGMIDGKQIAVYHGHHHNVLRNLIENMQYDVVITGHTHRLSVRVQGSTLVINPGTTSFSIPRSRNTQRNVVIYDTSQNKAKVYTL